MSIQHTVSNNNHIKGLQRKLKTVDEAISELHRKQRKFKNWFGYIVFATIFVSSGIANLIAYGLLGLHFWISISLSAVVVAITMGFLHFYESRFYRNHLDQLIEFKDGQQNQLRKQLMEAVISGKIVETKTGIVSIYWQWVLVESSDGQVSKYNARIVVKDGVESVEYNPC